MGWHLRIGPFGLDYDTEYGIDRRTGWTAVWRGSVGRQFVSFGAALLDLVRMAWGS